MIYIWEVLGLLNLILYQKQLQIMSVKREEACLTLTKELGCLFWTIKYSFSEIPNPLPYCLQPSLLSISKINTIKNLKINKYHFE